jgi:hypothetical protein
MLQPGTLSRWTQHFLRYALDEKAIAVAFSRGGHLMKFQIEYTHRAHNSYIIPALTNKSTQLIAQ